MPIVNLFLQIANRIYGLVSTFADITNFNNRKNYIMRNYFSIFIAIIASIASISFVSCGGRKSSSESKIFGSIPGIYADYQAKNADILGKMENCSSQDEGMKLFQEQEEIQKEYLDKIETVGKNFDGTVLDIESAHDFTITEPVIMTFDGFWSKLNLEPKFKLTGVVEAATDHESSTLSQSASIYVKDPSQLKAMPTPVMLVGMDSEGNELFSERVGHAPLSVLSETQIGVKAGTAIVFESLNFVGKKAEAYTKVVTLHLAYQL